MHLYLSNSPWNTTYRTESGQAIYKATSTFSLSAPRTITISRVQPADSIELDAEGNVPEGALRDSFTQIGEVEYHHIPHSKTRIRHAGKETPVRDFFRKEVGKWVVLGRVFIGPDGREYVWRTDPFKSKLYVKGEKETLVANFHQRHRGIFGKARPASLEIHPECEHMSDLILVTFLYIEKLRRSDDKERQPKRKIS